MEAEEPKQKQIHISAEKWPMFLELARDCDSALREEAQEMRERADIILAHNQQQSGFFEKLILLDTGAFALTLTFLGALGSHIHKPSPSFHLGWMYVGWLLLIVSVVLCWVENYFAYAQTVQMHNAAATQTAARRVKAKGLIIARFGQLATGSVDVEGAKIDVSKLYQSVAQIINQEFRRQLDAPAAHLERASSLGKYAFAWAP
jgi:hypothetical protein